MRKDGKMSGTKWLLLLPDSSHFPLANHIASAAGGTASASGTTATTASSGDEIFNSFPGSAAPSNLSSLQFPHLSPCSLPSPLRVQHTALLFP